MGSPYVCVIVYAGPYDVCFFMRCAQRSLAGGLTDMQEKRLFGPHLCVCTPAVRSVLNLLPEADSLSYLCSSRTSRSACIVTEALLRLLSLSLPFDETHY